MLSTYQIRFSVRLGRRSISSSHNVVTDGNSRFPKKLKRPIRGGQNLSERYRRLENSLRGKDALQRGLATEISQTLSPTTPVPAGSSAQTHTFHGFHIPQEPTPPADDECCMSGCAVCVYDLYEESLAAYKAEVDALRKALTGMKVPELKWPAHIRNAAVNLEAQRKETTLSAFEEMERALALKKQRRIEKDSNLPLAQQQRRNGLVHLEALTSMLSELYQCIQWVLFSRR